MNQDTLCLHAGYTPGNGEPRQIPIIQSTTFRYATSEATWKRRAISTPGFKTLPTTM